MMSEIVTIEETELTVQRKIAAEEDELRLIAMTKVRDPDRMIQIIREKSSESASALTIKS